jgi:glutamate synthase domain-containing protein 2
MHHDLPLPLQARYITFTLVIVATLLFALALATLPYSHWVLAGLVVAGALSLVGVHDLLQKNHSILRNYPIAAHLRFIFEEIRPELRQYFFEGDKDGLPFSRDRRAVVYQRAKNALDVRPFGTQYDVYAVGYEWMHHSIAPRPVSKEPFRIMIGGGGECTQPYSASVFNISAMSFGSLSANAIRALNGGAKLGGFAHDTGEGGYSPYHREMGGDIIWEIGSGYFGCRNPDGTFNREKFAEGAANPQVKMVELKLSQGAKPGHGGVLPGPKVSREISVTRGVPMGEDCISPSQHSAFTTPTEMMEFVGEMRRLSGGKPAGFKLCIGHEWEFLAICKAMLETDIYPDFIVVDGKEGGTGAAPMEFIDHIGKPMRQGLYFVHNALIGIGARHRIKLGAAGKIITAFDIIRAMALGADWCNAARGFMFAVGCIQSQSCHTDRCPTGVATQDPHRQKALFVPDKMQRVANFHRATLHELAEMTAAAGLDHPREFKPIHISRRVGASDVVTFADIYPPLVENELIAGTAKLRWKQPWDLAHPDSFRATA